MAPLVGAVDWSEAIDINVGAASIFTPVDYGFPSDGILAQGEMNQAQWVIAELDLAYIDEVRQNGQVINHRDWERQWPIYQGAAAERDWAAPVADGAAIYEAAINTDYNQQHFSLQHANQHIGAALQPV